MIPSDFLWCPTCSWARPGKSSFFFHLQASHFSAQPAKAVDPHSRSSHTHTRALFQGEKECVELWCMSFLTGDLFGSRIQCVAPFYEFWPPFPVILIFHGGTDRFSLDSRLGPISTKGRHSHINTHTRFCI